MVYVVIWSNFFYGLTIGLTLFVSVLAINTVTGCAINPAVYFGTLLPALSCKTYYGEEETGHIQTKYMWIYVISEPVGALLAGLIFKYFYCLPEFGNADLIKNKPTTKMQPMLVRDDSASNDQY